MSSADKVDAWMPLWIGEYLADTTALSRDQHGGYLLLLMAYWRNKGPLLERGNSLANIVKATPSEWRNRLRPVLVEFFSVEDDYWLHGRAEKELHAAGMRKSSAVAKAKAAAEARWKRSSEQCSEHAPSIAHALLEDCPPPSPSSPPTSEKVSKASPSHPPAGGRGARFVEFWEAWPKSERKQDKAKCLAHWKLHQLDGVADALLADVRRKRATTKWQDGFIEAPLVYLRGRRWEDGVEPDSEGGNEVGGTPWYDTRSGIEAKGEALGLGRWDEAEWARGGESFQRYTARVFRAAGLEPPKVNA